AFARRIMHHRGGWELSDISRRWVLQGGIAAGLAWAATPTCAQSWRGLNDREHRALAACARAFMKQHDIPGVSVAITQRGRILNAAGFGFAERRTGEQVTVSHLFRIASVSKPITSVGVFSLMEAGKLKLADKVFGPGGILESEFEVPPGRHIN